MVPAVVYEWDIPLSVAPHASFDGGCGNAANLCCSSVDAFSVSLESSFPNLGSIKLAVTPVADGDSVLIDNRRNAFGANRNRSVTCRTNFGDLSIDHAGHDVDLAVIDGFDFT